MNNMELDFRVVKIEYCTFMGEDAVRMTLNNIDNLGEMKIALTSQEYNENTYMRIGHMVRVVVSPHEVETRSKE